MPASGSPATSTFIVLAMTQMLGVGMTTLVSHAAGQKDRDRARPSSTSRSCCRRSSGCCSLPSGWRCAVAYVAALAADPDTGAAGGDYLLWFIPAMALQFAMVAMGAALRGTGNFKPGMIVATATVDPQHRARAVPDLRVGHGPRRSAWLARRSRRSSRSRSASVWLIDVLPAAGSYLKFVRRGLDAGLRALAEDARHRPARRARSSR